MKKWLTLFSLILTITIISSCKKPTIDNPYPFDPNLYGQSNYTSDLDKYIKDRMTNGNVQGLAVAVIKRHKLEFSKGYGLLWKDALNPAASPQVTVNTNFYTGELSNPMVTIAVMQLHDQGLVDMDVDINQYINFAVHNPTYMAEPITLRMLLSGTSTVKDNPIYTPPTFQVTNGDHSIKLNDYLKAYLTPSGIYYDSANNYDNTDKPGRVYNSSKVAIALAAYVVESVKGISINEYCKAYIYPELGTFGTSFFLAEMDLYNLARRHTNTPLPFVPRPHTGIPIYPGGQLRTSVTHAARTLIAFMEKGQYDQQRLIDSATVKKMRDISFPIANLDQATTMKYMNFNGRRILGLSAEGEGYTNRMYYDSLTNIGVVILSNSDNCAPQVDSIMEKLFLNAE